MGGVVTDTNCQRASQSLYETIAVSLFARLPPRALLACDTSSATFSPRIFEQKRDCSQSTLINVRAIIRTQTKMFCDYPENKNLLFIFFREKVRATNFTKFNGRARVSHNQSNSDFARPQKCSKQIRQGNQNKCPHNKFE